LLPGDADPVRDAAQRARWEAEVERAHARHAWDAVGRHIAAAQRLSARAVTAVATLPAPPVVEPKEPAAAPAPAQVRPAEVPPAAAPASTPVEVSDADFVQRLRAAAATYARLGEHVASDALLVGQRFDVENDRLVPGEPITVAATNTLIRSATAAGRGDVREQLAARFGAGSFRVVAEDPAAAVAALTDVVRRLAGDPEPRVAFVSVTLEGQPQPVIMAVVAEPVTGGSPRVVAALGGGRTARVDPGAGQTTVEGLLGEYDGTPNRVEVLDDGAVRGRMDRNVRERAALVADSSAFATATGRPVTVDDINLRTEVVVAAGPDGVRFLGRVATAARPPQVETAPDAAAAPPVEAGPQAAAAPAVEAGPQATRVHPADLIPTHELWAGDHRLREYTEDMRAGRWDWSRPDAAIKVAVHEGRYYIIDGQHRRQAALNAGEDSVPIVDATQELIDNGITLEFFAEPSEPLYGEQDFPGLNVRVEDGRPPTSTTATVLPGAPGGIGRADPAGIVAAVLDALRRRADRVGTPTVAADGVLVVPRGARYALLFRPAPVREGLRSHREAVPGRTFAGRRVVAVDVPDSLPLGDFLGGLSGPQGEASRAGGLHQRDVWVGRIVDHEIAEAGAAEQRGVFAWLRARVSGAPADRADALVRGAEPGTRRSPHDEGHRDEIIGLARLLDEHARAGGSAAVLEVERQLGLLLDTIGVGRPDPNDPDGRHVALRWALLDLPAPIRRIVEPLRGETARWRRYVPPFEVAHIIDAIVAGIDDLAALGFGFDRVSRTQTRTEAAR
jgi:hypothetical protein